jgi:hypothetical protein
MKEKVHENAGNGNPAKAVLFFMLFTMILTGAIAQGNLLIFPKRIVFDDNKKVQDIFLINSGSDTAVYNISFLQYRMTEYGDFQTITQPDSGQNFANPYLRVFPRKVILAPNETQTVKVQLTKTNDLQAGEYRSHLYFRATRNNLPLGDERPADTNSITVRLKPVYGISIACIIRKGEPSTSVAISGLEFENKGDSAYFLKMNFNRTGNMSTYGDISVDYINNDNKSFDVGKVQGVAVYTPGKVRKCKMELLRPKGVDFNGGRFEVVYSNNDGDRPVVIAESELILKSNNLQTVGESIDK